jgi:NADPH:quinone reductase-like Zn-dependent oxidoreductase
MKAMVVTKYGAPEVLEYREWPEPVLKPGEVLIRVAAIGINFADILGRMGYYGATPKAPFVPGLEVSGVVEEIAIGDQRPVASLESREPRAARPESSASGFEFPVSNFQKGDRVAALTMFRGYAEKVAVPASQVFRVPEPVTLEEAAAMPVNYLTAYHSMFHMGNLQPGDRILIHGAAGGVGVAAVQLAKARKLVIFGTASTPKQDYLRQIGVDYPIDYTKQDFEKEVRRIAPDGIELAFDAVGGESFTKSRRCLGPCGRLVVYGFSVAVGASGKRDLWRGAKALLKTQRYHPLKLIDQNLAVIGVHIGRMRGREALLRREMEEIFRMYQAGEVKPVIGKTFPLREAAAAHRYIHDRKNIGKVLLIP